MDRLKAIIFTYRGAFVPLSLLPPLLLPHRTSGTWGLLGGIALVALGLFFRIAGVRMIGGQARIHSGGARRLISEGIYARVRNPLYVGNAFVVGGGAALFFSPWSVPLVLVYLFLLYTVVALYEEQCLADQMGAPFLQYLQNVPRWIPRIRAHRRDSGPDDAPRTAWLTVLRNERWFLLCCLSLTVLGILLHDRPLLPSGDGDGAVLRLIAPAAVLLVAAVLFVRIALRLQRKRGGWLRVERIAGRD